MRLIEYERTHFAVRFPPDRSLHGAIRAIPGAKWDARDGRWKVPVSCRTFLRDFAHGAEFTVTPEAEAELARETVDGTAMPDLSAPLRSGRVLFEHQRRGVQDLVRGKYMILADDMGLGKTTQALVAAQIIGHPIHVICPVSLRDNWTNEATPLGVSIRTYSWAKLPASIPGNYTIIADEAHYAQSGTKSQRGKAFLALAAKAQAVFCLTGTPMKNGRPANLFPLLRAIRCPLAANRSWYELRYCDAQETEWSRWDVSGAKNLDELHARLKPWMIRRMKEDCLDLPAKTRVMRHAEHSAEAVRIYRETYDGLLARYLEKAASETSDAMVRFGFRRQAASLAKVNAALEIADEIIEQGGSVVFFTAYRETAARIHRAMTSAGSFLLTGETPQEERTQGVALFQAGKFRSFVTTFGAGGVGITLTKAQTVILVDRPWTPGDTMQAEDRIHRIGQQGSVLAIWIQWDETDQAVDALLDDKNERIELVMSGKKVVLTREMSERQLKLALAGGN